MMKNNSGIIIYFRKIIPSAALNTPSRPSWNLVDLVTFWQWPVEGWDALTPRRVWMVVKPSSWVLSLQGLVNIARLRPTPPRPSCFVYIAFPTRDSHTTGKCLLDLVRARGGDDIKKFERSRMSWSWRESPVAGHGLWPRSLNSSGIVWLGGPKYHRFIMCAFLYLNGYK